VAYSIDLTQIPLARFAETLTTVELLPSRKALADHISAVVARLEQREIADLGMLRRLLADKQRYPTLAPELGVDVEYLTLLNREVNAYRSKPVALAKLDVFSEAELDRLAAISISSTKNLYERCGNRSDRDDVIHQLGLRDDRVVEALELSNLVRINGVGPAFAHFLRDLGVRGPDALLATDTEEIVLRYQRAVADQPGQPKLRVEDIEYCKRFSVDLAADIEW
jgi:hypothetical protein